jgi:hypothetical protein
MGLRRQPCRRRDRPRADGGRPAAVIESIRRADLFATLVPDDTYTVASRSTICS